MKEQAKRNDRHSNHLICLDLLCGADESEFTQTTLQNLPTCLAAQHVTVPPVTRFRVYLEFEQLYPAGRAVRCSLPLRVALPAWHCCVPVAFCANRASLYAVTLAHLWQHDM